MNSQKKDAQNGDNSEDSDESEDETVQRVEAMADDIDTFYN